MENIEDIRTFDITVGQLKNLFSQYKAVVIKPMGSLTYFEGKMRDIPSCLLNVAVREIRTFIKQNEDENANQKYYTEVLLYVEKIEENALSSWSGKFLK